MTDHKFLPDEELHEPLGVATAVAGDVYVADGSASGDWIQMSSANVPGTVTQGWWNYEDSATAVTPIDLTPASTYIELTNDGLGTNTDISMGLAGLTDIWDESTNRLLLNTSSILELGDTFDIRLDLSITTTSANTDVDIDVEYGVGSGSEYRIKLLPLTSYKTTGTYSISATQSFFLGNTETLSYPARLLMQASDTGTSVVVKGLFIRALKTN